MPAPPSGVKPSPLLHCEKVYLKMRNDANEIHETDVPMVIWEGFFTRLIKELELAVPYYSTIRRALLDMGCIRQLRRGGGTSPSQWELLKEPTLELWNAMQENGPVQGTRAGSVNAASRSELKQVNQRLTDLQDRIDVLEESLKIVVELFNNNLPKRKGA